MPGIAHCEKRLAFSWRSNQEKVMSTGCRDYGRVLGLLFVRGSFRNQRTSESRSRNESDASAILKLAASLKKLDYFLEGRNSINTAPFIAGLCQGSQGGHSFSLPAGTKAIAQAWQPTRWTMHRARDAPLHAARAHP